jgi:hypothetical protein
MLASRFVLSLAAGAFLALPALSAARADEPLKGAPAGAGVGPVVEEVNFPISCSPASQKAFNHAAWTLHSFWYPEALTSFSDIAKGEPGCAMAYWGIAMSHWYPLWFPPSEAALKAGSEAVQKAEAAGPKTEREKAYVAAIAAFYRDYDKADHKTRAVAYEKAMEQVHAKYPDDAEAGVFYSLALNATQPPTDKTFANKKKAAEILDKVWKEHPNHPGIVHYLIHSDDTQQLAEAGLPAAMCYAKIAPAVPHALHMPSHIFTRLGLWQQSIDSNKAAHDAAVAYARTAFGEGGYDSETVHTMDYMVYAYLQTGQDAKAKAVQDELLGYKKSAAANLPTAYAVAAIPARYAVERGDWKAAAALPAPGIGFPLEKFPWAEGMIVFARSLGAARTGDLAAAETEIGKLAALRDKLVEAKDTYWANQVEVQRLEAAAVLAHAGKDDKKAVVLARQAAELDAGMDKHPATPAAVLPARELLADLLLELKDPAALQAYDDSLKSEPNRFRSILGKARAARAAGDLDASRDAYKRLVALSAQADTDRPELAEAKGFLSN